jgi:hypothetical protein
MAVGFPTKVTYANGDVFSASDINDTNGTLNLLSTSVVQTLSVQSSTQQTTTSATYADITNHTLTITPKYSTSKILVVSTNSLLASAGAADSGIRILRGATNIFTSIQMIGVSNSGGSFTSIYLDSPATTSATTYKAQWNRATGAGTVFSNIGGTLSNLILMEILV